VVSQWPDESCLLPFITGFFGKADALANGQAVKAARSNAVPMKVNLAIIGCCDEAVILKERFDYAVRRHLMGLDAPVLLAEHIFELTVRGTEGVVDRYLHIVMAFANTRIVADVNVRASRHRQMDAYLIRVARMMPLTRLRDNNARRGYVLVHIVKSLGLLSNPGLNGFGVVNAFKGDLERSLHE
jgi:hypothetical protein